MTFRSPARVRHHRLTTPCISPMCGFALPDSDSVAPTPQVDQLAAPGRQGCQR